jgi:hypothetical protein
MVAFATSYPHFPQQLVPIRAIRGKRDHLSKKFAKSAGKGILNILILILHIPSILPTHFIQRIGNVTQRAIFNRFHQFLK